MKPPADTPTMSVRELLVAFHPEHGGHSVADVVSALDDENAALVCTCGAGLTVTVADVAAAGYKRDVVKRALLVAPRKAIVYGARR